MPRVVGEIVKKRTMTDREEDRERKRGERETKSERGAIHGSGTKRIKSG